MLLVLPLCKEEIIQNQVFACHGRWRSQHALCLCQEIGMGWWFSLGVCLLERSGRARPELGLSMAQQLKKGWWWSPGSFVLAVIAREGHKKGSISCLSKSLCFAYITSTNLLPRISSDINTSISDLAVSFFSHTGINIDSGRVRDSKLKLVKENVSSQVVPLIAERKH